MRPVIALFIGLFLLLSNTLSAQNEQFNRIQVSSETQGGFPQHIRETAQTTTSWYAVLTDYVNQLSTGTHFQLHKSTNNGQTWTKVPFFSDKNVLNIKTHLDTIWVITAQFYFNSNSLLQINAYRSVNNGASFTQTFTFGEYSAGSYDSEILQEANNVLFFSVRYYKNSYLKYQRYYSMDRGASWQAGNTSQQNETVRMLYADGRYYQFFNGTSFVKISDNPAMDNSAIISVGTSSKLVDAWKSNDTMFVVDKFGKVLYKKAPFNTGAFSSAGNLPFKTSALFINNGQGFYASEYGGIYKFSPSTPWNAQMLGFYPRPYPVSTGYYPYRSFGMLGSHLYYFGKLPLVSDDDGANWDFPTDGLQRVNGSVAVYNQELWMRQGFNGRYRNGNWHVLRTYGLPDNSEYQWDKMVEIQGKLYVATKTDVPARLYRSDDGGDNWTLVRTFDGWGFLSADEEKTRLIFSIYTNGVKTVWYSDAGVNNWATIPGLPGPRTILMAGDTVFAVAGHKFYRSFDLGQNWEQFTLTYPVTADLDSTQTYLYKLGHRILLAAGSKYGIYYAHLSNNYGADFWPVVYYDDIWYQKPYLYFTAAGETYVSGNLGISGVRFSTNDWKFKNTYAVKDGYLYGTVMETNSNNIIAPVGKTLLSPILDSLQNGEIGFVRGALELDNDQNCQMSAGDTPVSGQAVVFQPGNLMALSYPDGSIYRSLPEGDYSVDLGVNPFLITNKCIDPALISLQGDSVRQFNIGLTGTITPDLAVSEHHNNIRPGRSTTYRIKVRNTGYVPSQAATLSVQYPVSIFDSYASSLTPIAAQPGLLQYSVPEMAPTSEMILYLALTVPPNPQLAGMFVIVKTQLDAPYSDADSTNNMVQTIDLVTNSHDPNDKTAITAAAPYEVLPLADKSILYRIRFQNTGTDTAFTVVVVDTLSDRLDWSTFRMVDAGHPYRLAVHDPGILVWTFDPIKLPDSNHNEAASHGFIEFKIKAKSNVKVDEVLRNRAAIYFDFNEPVFTNTTETRVVRRVFYRDAVAQKPVREEDWYIVPNPASDRVEIRFGHVTGPDCRLQVLDALGRVVRETVVPEQVETFNLTLNSLEKGIYRLSWRDGARAGAKTLAVE